MGNPVRQCFWNCPASIWMCLCLWQTGIYGLLLATYSSDKSCCPRREADSETVWISNVKSTKFKEKRKKMIGIII